jgi:hypothetical protein
MSIAKCSQCGKECSFTDNQGRCYNCMTEEGKRKSKEYFENVKREMGLTEGGNEESAPTKEEFEKQSEFENRMRTFVHELRKAKEEEDLAEAEEKGLEVKAKGSISLRPEDIDREQNSDYRGKTFNSHEEMISYLRLEAMKGNAEAKENLDKLWKKVVSGIREQPTKANFQFQDKNWLSDFKKKQTEAWKKERGVKID